MNAAQNNFAKAFLSPFKQRLYFFKNLPMGVLSGIKLIELTTQKSVATVPYFWWNKNPFSSMYFAVQSMAAELSTAAVAMLAQKTTDAKIVLIIVNMKAEFVKKAQSKITFTCLDYPKFERAIGGLIEKDAVASVTAETIGTDENGEIVARFHFTWSYKRKN